MFIFVTIHIVWYQSIFGVIARTIISLLSLLSVLSHSFAALGKRSCKASGFKPGAFSRSRALTVKLYPFSNVNYTYKVLNWSLEALFQLLQLGDFGCFILKYFIFFGAFYFSWSFGSQLLIPLLCLNISL